MEKKVITCVYCGQAYPEGTPTHGACILSEHIKVCEKHPLKFALEKIKKLREALFSFIGVSTYEEFIKIKKIFPEAMQILFDTDDEEEVR